jgi:predicted Zn-dependent peptidase
MKSKFYRKILKNGITLLFEKRDLPVVSVAIAVKMGGIHESPEEKGISHFIEHMLYKGTPTRNARKIAEEIEKNGGELNGFTSEEITTYWCKIPSKKLKIALDVLSDMVKNPLFDEKELEKEREVIFEEIKLYHDNPRLHVFDETQKILYNGTMKINLAGTFETMRSIDRKKILEKFSKAYKPNKMIICLVGDAEIKELIKFAEKTFEKAKADFSEQKFGLENSEKIEKREGIDQANLVFAYHVPLAGDDKSYAAMVLNAITADGMSSRLFSEIREKRNLAYAVKGISNINKTFAYNSIYVGTKKENVEKVKELILKEFEKISKDLDEKELDSVKEQLIGNYQISMEDSQTQLVNLLASEIHGNAKTFYEFEDKIKKVKLEDVKELAGKVKDRNYSFFALVPK